MNRESEEDKRDRKKAWLFFVLAFPLLVFAIALVFALVLHVLVGLSWDRLLTYCIWAGLTCAACALLFLRPRHIILGPRKEERSNPDQENTRH